MGFLTGTWKCVFVVPDDKFDDAVKVCERNIGPRIFNLGHTKAGKFWMVKKKHGSFEAPGVTVFFDDPKFETFLKLSV